MMRRIFCATAIALLSTAGLSAQTIRFDTNVGTFDMVLNPTGNPFLQNHVDNILAYTETGRYDLTVINRAATNFVLQMGGFRAPFLTLPSSFSAFPSVVADDPVIVDADKDGNIDFDIGNLSNTRATVSLALSSNNANSGTSSFFINLSDSNTFLDDSDFIPFAEIRNMETVNLIMSLPQANLDSSGSNLAAINIPILEDNKLVIIERAFVLDATEEMIAAAMANATIGAGPVALNSEVDPPLNDPGGLLIVPTVPEPSTMFLASALAMLSLLKRR